MTDFTSLHLERGSVAAAKRLLGCVLVREINGQHVRVKIVETEAYDQKDAASHSYRGQTPRTSIMFGPAGYAYVYFTYGMHHCFNVVTGRDGEGSAVLIRAVEPIDGVVTMQQLRPMDVHQLTNGPAKLCQALAIDRRLNGHDMRELPLQLHPQPAVKASNIVATTRIGITRDTHRLWRFYIRDNQFVSR